MVRQGLRSLLSQFPGFEVVAEASNGHETLLKTEKLLPDVVLLDYEMPNFNGIYAAKEISRRNHRTRILILSTHSSKEHLISAIHAGVHGYLPKETGVEEIAGAIKELAQGGTWFKGTIAESIAPFLVASMNKNGRSRSHNLLTERETELIRYWSRGMSSKEIAEVLSISRRTVEVHKANIFKKLGLKNTTELIRYAIHNQIVKV